jgi:hypothetical protein
MKKSLFAALLLAGAGSFGASATHAAEGDVGTVAFPWTNLSDLAPSPTTYSLSQYSGKVVLLVVFQYNCGGCVGNAPKIGRLADTLYRSSQGAKFQAIGAEIATAAYANIQSYRNSLTDSNRLVINFPTVKVPHDTNISASDGTGEKWKRYNSYRDTYFVIGHDGLIKAKIVGNRGNAMSSTLYQNLRTALNNALAAAPSSLSPSAEALPGFRADRIGRGYRFRMDGTTQSVSLRILDLQGRVVRAVTLTTSAPEALWNGTDAAGNVLPYGLYFAHSESNGQGVSRRLPLLP